MIRVTHPRCCSCGSPNPDFESQRWQLRVCFMCLRATADWLAELDPESFDGNPFTEELFDGVFEWGQVPTSTQYRVQLTSRRNGSTVEMHLFNRPTRKQNVI